MTLRVVSLVPSVSETLVALGVVPVAVTRFCELPGLPTVGGTKNPDVAKILALGPDLVVVDREENRREDADALERGGVTVHVTDVRHFTDVGPTVARLCGVLGVDAPRADARGVTTARRRGDRELRAWVPIWRRPWMTINAETYGSSVLAMAGVVNVFGDHPDSYPTVGLDEVRARRPDVVLAPSEPYPWTERHRHLFDDVAPMVVVDGRDVFWWGSRSDAALGRLGDAVARLQARPAGLGPGGRRSAT